MEAITSGTAAYRSWEWRVATYKATVEQNPWIPEDSRNRGLSENPKQRQFLLLSDVQEVFYGGAAGGGKTYATLIAAAQYVDVPGYSALLLRENFADLNQAKAWIDLSRSWWYGKGVNWNERDRRWTFPSGATITFGYLDSDKAVYQYDSAAFQFIAIDELTQHTEWRYQFMFGRLRRPATGPLSQVPIRMRSTSNPGNSGHEWVKRRFVDAKKREPGAVFVPARLEDNKGNLDVEEYRTNALAKLDPLTRAQREKGDWDAVAGGKFRAEWLRNTWTKDPTWKDWCVLTGFGPTGKAEVLERFKWRNAATFQTYDPSASASNAADHFVVSTWKVTPEARLVWWDCYRDKMEIPEQLGICQSLYRQHKPQFIAVEEVLNQRAHAQFLRKSTAPVMIVRSVNPKSRDKLDRALGAISLAASGRLFLPDDHPLFPLEDVRGELVRFTGLTDDEQDDIVDTFSYACECLPSVRVTGGAGSGAAPFIYQSRRGQYDGLK